MARIGLAVPDTDLCAEFEKWATPLLDQQRCLEESNRQLGDLRDALLPKLMSGEIDVSQIDVMPPNNHLAEHIASNQKRARSASSLSALLRIEVVAIEILDFVAMLYCYSNIVSNHKLREFVSIYEYQLYGVLFAGVLFGSGREMCGGDE